jgi:rhombotail lipoprotein
MEFALDGSGDEQEYAPDHPDGEDAASRAVSLRHLLTHELPKNALPNAPTRQDDRETRVAAEFKGLDYIQSIEIVPSTYLRTSGGFDNLNQVRSLLGVDVIGLVAYD